ncbi:HpcH/HpaI aldolase/citrate lyase family protein [Marinivivus vitaminiproducens]|uniref:HpcH/HpaI aldolase/citrate lyase family protein n=1 Tax=Marinivivus vitaminiproducens TaxID=3035935 RepID=UPI003F9ED0A1
MRSKLFVPGSRPELFAKALASDADGISIDLEDAVEASRKDEARGHVRDLLREAPGGTLGKIVIVRPNALSTPHFLEDLSAVVWPALDMVNVPKVESADDVREAARHLATIEAERGIKRPVGILANIESPRGLRLAAEIACADPRVVGLQVGFGDLLEPLGIDRRNPAAMQQIQLQIRIAAGEAGIWAYDGAWAGVKDAEFYVAEAEMARRLGYLGKSCIHPSQIALANAAFRPTDAEIAESLRIVEATRTATADGVGAYLVDGRMIDAPFARRAEAIVALAERLGLLPDRA